MELMIKVKPSYEIIIENNSLDKIKDLININNKVLIITDSGVPKEYYEKVLKAYDNSYLYILPQGEENKNIHYYQEIMTYLIDHSFTRKDFIISVGGGVVGDLAGYVASTYMRGIDFYNIPTTLLSQVDSSIGGKTAINFNKVKNIIGTFYQPKKVIIDPITLKTLDQRLISEGLAECIKMAACFNKDFFNYLKNNQDLDYEYVITESIKIKKIVVEIDEKELGLRRSLNFGHTIGHAIEALALGDLYHGECVSLGMLYMSSPIVKKELTIVLKKYNLPVELKLDKDLVVEKIKHDKKADNDLINIIYVEEIGSYQERKIKIDEIYQYLD